MNPIVVRRFAIERPVLVLAFLDNGRAVVVEEGGRMGLEDIRNLTVLRPNLDFPVDYSFFEVQSLEAVS